MSLYHSKWPYIIGKFYQNQEIYGFLQRFKAASEDLRSADAVCLNPAGNNSKQKKIPTIKTENKSILFLFVYCDHVSVMN